MCVIVKTERRIKRGGRGSRTLIVRHVNVSTCHATAGLMRFPDDFSRVWVRVPRRDNTVGATRCRDERWCGRVPPSFWVWRAAVFCWCPTRSFARAAVGPRANRPRSPRAPGRTCPATITWTWTGCWKTTSWWRRTSSVSWTRDTAPRKPNKSKVGATDRRWRQNYSPALYYVKTSSRNNLLGTLARVFNRWFLFERRSRQVSLRGFRPCPKTVRAMYTVGHRTELAPIQCFSDNISVRRHEQF